MLRIMSTTAQNMFAARRLGEPAGAAESLARATRCKRLESPSGVPRVYIDGATGAAWLLRPRPARPGVPDEWVAVACQVAASMECAPGGAYHATANGGKKEPARNRRSRRAGRARRRAEGCGDE